MSKTSRKRSVVAALLVVLFFGTMTAAAWHHHEKSNFETCQACHLGKHSLAPPSAGLVIEVSAVVTPYRGIYKAWPRWQVSFSRPDLRAPPIA